MTKLARHIGIVAFAVSGSFLAFSLHAETHPARLFSDHMVLQRDVADVFWGTDIPGQNVSVEISGVSNSAVADPTGFWTVKLAPHTVGGPFAVKVQGSSSVLLQDVYFGDVWVASGQSNMEMPMAGWPGSADLEHSAEEIAQANHPEIRLLHVGKKSSAYPLEDLSSPSAWKVCSPETIGPFTAVGYFFARSIAQHEHIPIGVVEADWGGTPAEAWISLGGLAGARDLKRIVSARAIDMQSEPAILRQREQDARNAAAGIPAPKRSGDRTDNWALGGLYNGMIAPLVRMPIKGVIWFQGESNTDPSRADVYAGLFADLISDWRERWQQPSLPFLYVQISAYGKGSSVTWPKVRDAQRRVLAVPMTGMAVTLDLGEANQIHFGRKQPVGERLALLARAMVYGESIESSGPLFRSAVPDGNRMRVNFDHAGQMHTSDGGPLGGFEVAGADHVFVTAEAVIEANSVTLYSSRVAQPVEVRYAWRGFPDNANLVNGAGLPASPFSSAP